MIFNAGSVRPAVAADARAIAEVHVESSRAAYAGIYPESWLARLSVEERARFWSANLAAGEPGWVLLAGCDETGRVVGFACGGPERTGRLACDGELYAIYLLPAAQRQGLGRLLVHRMVAELRSAGFGSMAVWVLARNAATRFYEMLGGQRVSSEEFERDGVWFEGIAYAWSDLGAFPSESEPR